ncbi:MAG TPA: glycosyltransferase [Phycisphaerales bacterium]|nr:glycosyltransferase [Phycisphaerales bacterium]
MPAVSIVMTLYNRARWVEAAARSVLAQTEPDLELVIVDDGSTDGSLEIAHRLAARDPRVRVFAEQHRGVAGTLKRAHELTLGSLIGWVDSDDLLVTDAVAKCRAVLESRPDAGVVYTDHVEIDEAGCVLREGVRSKRPYSRDALLTDLMTFQFRLFRRSVFDACGGIDASFTAAPDYDFCLRASEVTEFAYLPEPLYCYRQHPGSISAARQAEQVANSQRAVENALMRRGLADKVRLKVTLRAVFELVPKQD